MVVTEFQPARCIAAVSAGALRDTSWAPVVAFWAGNFWQVVVVYELCHALIHHDAWAPKVLTGSRLYRWWKGCHFEHHFHTPARNFSVTCPLLDVLFGTYVAPRAQYEPLPHPKLKPEGDGYSLPPQPAES